MRTKKGEIYGVGSCADRQPPNPTDNERLMEEKDYDERGQQFFPNSWFFLKGVLFAIRTIGSPMSFFEYVWERDGRIHLARPTVCSYMEGSELRWVLELPNACVPLPGKPQWLGTAEEVDGILSRSENPRVLAELLQALEREGERAISRLQPSGEILNDAQRIIGLMLKDKTIQCEHMGSHAAFCVDGTFLRELLHIVEKSRSS